VSTYPGALDGLGANNPLGTDIRSDHAAKHSEERDAVDAIQETLGVNPQGTELTVVARLNEIEADIAGISLTAADTSFDDTGLDHFTGANVQAAIAAGDTAVDQALAIGDSVAVRRIFRPARLTASATIGSVAAGAIAKVPSLSKSITAASATDEFRIRAFLNADHASNQGVSARLIVDDAILTDWVGDTASNRIRMQAGQGSNNGFIASQMELLAFWVPGDTDPHTIEIEVKHHRDQTADIFINRSGDDSDTTRWARYMSFIEVWEVVVDD
jgi:hypothetical protein